jgi:hypothetical protein
MLLAQNIFVAASVVQIAIGSSFLHQNCVIMAQVSLVAPLSHQASRANPGLPVRPVERYTFGLPYLTFCQ